MATERKVGLFFTATIDAGDQIVNSRMTTLGNPTSDELLVILLSLAGAEQHRAEQSIPSAPQETAATTSSMLGDKGIVLYSYKHRVTDEEVRAGPVYKPITVEDVNGVQYHAKVDDFVIVRKVEGIYVLSPPNFHLNYI